MRKPRFKHTIYVGFWTPIGEPYIADPQGLAVPCVRVAVFGNPKVAQTDTRVSSLIPLNPEAAAWLAELAIGGVR